MRCEHCQSDVAAQVAEDGSVICGNCGTLIDAAGHPQLEERLRQAKELLERWSKEPLLEPFEPLPGKQASHLSEVEKFQAQNEPESQNKAADVDPEPDSEELASSPEPESDSSTEDDVNDALPETSYEVELHEVSTPPNSGKKKPKTNFRFDAAHVPEESDPSVSDVLNELPGPESVESEPFDFDALDAITAETDEEPAESNTEAPEPAATAPVAQTPFQMHRIDDAQPAAVHSPPHLDIQQLIDQRLQEEKQGFNWMVFAGQWLSYLGVLGLTAGAALIVYGYFGGMAEMTPKGWMLTTGGQMLLLLGIVTLISGGLDQANTEVNTRIQVLGEQMLRFERETKEHFLRGPKIPPSQYAKDAQPDEPKKTADKRAES